jgi:probable F420-dependent oxidoreductase
MRLSIPLPNNIADDPGDWSFIVDYAQYCDRTGVDRVVAADHVVFGEHLEAYGQAESGGIANATQPTGSDGYYLDPMTLLAAASSVTQNVRLGTNILLAALRRPVVLAKAAATLDVLSGGRLDLGVGVGWQREEYDAAALDFGRRGRLLDHTLEVCQTLWLENRADYSSPELTFEHIHMMPKPVQPRGVPIWVSGRATDRVARRLARFGSGWIIWDISVDDMADSIARMRDMVAQANGDASAFPVQAGIFVERHDDGTYDLDKAMAPLAKMA